MEKQELLEQLWQSDNISDNINFFRNINNTEEIIKFSQSRPNPNIKIHQRGNADSEIKFIIPTMDPNSIICKNIEKIYNNYSIFFIESQGKFFNYSKAINVGIDHVIKNEVNASYIILSNDDIILDKMSALKLPSLTFSTKKAYCLTPSNREYSGENVILTAPGHMLTLKDHLFSRLKGDLIRAEIVRILNNKSIHFAKVISNKYFIDRLIFNYIEKFKEPKNSAQITNFADFGIFHIKLLTKNKLDETFINGWEDWDLSYRLKRQNVEINRVDLKFQRIGHASIGKVMSKEKEIIHSFLNGIYFYWKHIQR